MPVRVDGRQMYGYLHRGRGRGVAFPHRFEQLSRGVYAIGVASKDQSGRPFAQVLGPPERFEGGEHGLTFLLVPSASLSGRVLDLDASLELFREVRDPAGRRLPLLDASNRAVLARPIPGDGRFELQRLPAGTVVLRVGTRRELEQGVTAIGQVVEVAADETASVELRWR